jgi:hypothetical protein
MVGPARQRPYRAITPTSSRPVRLEGPTVFPCPPSRRHARRCAVSCAPRSPHAARRCAGPRPRSLRAEARPGLARCTATSRRQGRCPTVRGRAGPSEAALPPALYPTGFVPRAVYPGPGSLQVASAVPLWELSPPVSTPSSSSSHGRRREPAGSRRHQAGVRFATPVESTNDSLPSTERIDGRPLHR